MWDKFEQFDIAVEDGEVVGAPLLRHCHANLECRIADDSLVGRYNFFILEVVKACIARRPKHPTTLHYTTLHYTGDGTFLQSGKVVNPFTLDCGVELNNEGLLGCDGKTVCVANVCLLSAHEGQLQ